MGCDRGLALVKAANGTIDIKSNKKYIRLLKNNPKKEVAKTRGDTAKSTLKSTQHISLYKFI